MSVYVGLKQERADYRVKGKGRKEE
ncbi:uncharacterized protein G2W53_037630 [Senna tora]|uniref:Uncharacterized protein n=1 Tax=Senna tora TaxID=362788 RepID=A0A834SXV5_9FABA|nr:uncharacterized protein G2W53_037630 [Senna tora]